MKNDVELAQRAILNISDAQFVRECFIPNALAQERWNIAIYESCRATELLLRGMIYQLGFEPQTHHDIPNHVAYLLDRLPGSPYSKYSKIPFTIGVYAENGYSCGVMIDRDYVNNLQIYENWGGGFTLLASKPLDIPEEGPIKFGIEVNGMDICFTCNDVFLLCVNVTPFCVEPFKVVDMSFVRQPTKVRIKLLKGLGKRLTKKRNIAYYGEYQYKKDDALEAVTDMEAAFGTTSAFFDLKKGLDT